MKSKLTKAALLQTLDCSLCCYPLWINDAHRYKAKEWSDWREYHSRADGLMVGAAWFAAHLGIATPLWQRPTKKREAA